MELFDEYAQASIKMAYIYGGYIFTSQTKQWDQSVAEGIFDDQNFLVGMPGELQILDSDKRAVAIPVSTVRISFIVINMVYFIFIICNFKWSIFIYAFVRYIQVHIGGENRMQDGEIFCLCLGEGHFFSCTSKKIPGKVFNVIMPGI